VAHEVRQPRPLGPGPALPPFEQQPPRLGQQRLPSLSAQLVDFVAAHLIDRFAHLLGNVKTIEDVKPP